MLVPTVVTFTTRGRHILRSQRRDGKGDHVITMTSHPYRLIVIDSYRAIVTDPTNPRVYLLHADA